MAFNLNTSPTTILNSSAVGAGQWYRVHRAFSKLSFQFLHTGTTVGATVQSTGIIQVSNDGVNPLLTTGGSTVDAIGTVVLNGGSPQSAGFTVDASWEWIRANILATSTGTIQVIVSAQESAR